MTDAPLKLEVGGTYKNRKEEIVYIAYCHQLRGDRKEFSDDTEDNYLHVSYQEDGTASVAGFSEENYDLIEEVKDA